MTKIELIMPKILSLFLQPFSFFFKYLQRGVPSPTPGLSTIPHRKGEKSLQLVCITKMIFLRQGLQSARLLCPWDFPGENIRVGCHFLLQRIFPTQTLNLLVLLLSHFSRGRLCVTPQMATHQAPPSLGFSRQEHWSGWPFPSPMHESVK